MRVYITLLVAIATLFATSEAAGGSSTKLMNAESTAGLQTQSNGQRFLRKRDVESEIDELDSEERAFDTKKIGEAVKGMVTSKNKKLVNLLKLNTADDVLFSKNVNPASLKRAVEKLKNKLTPQQYQQFKQAAASYDDYWYRVANLDPIR